MFKKILVANRGEIACRVFTTLKRLGIGSVAVYSDADSNARHVRQADEVWPLGGAAAADSYLNIERLIEVARRSGAQAIHPGYGFLSESEAFAQACATAGLVFIGPGRDAIRAMGLKDSAKAIMSSAGVPVVPGYQDSAEVAPASDPQLLEEAKRIGFPLLIKAVAGGGGKGMRRVDRSEQFQAALDGARREAVAAFGDERVMLEKYLLAPRHIEIQVFGDQHGNYVHLFERDCSLQRRHQKVVEESPSPFVDTEMRAAMGAAAVAAAKAVDYRGAGTVEFIVDADGDFYFLEMNTRLQVEHPVTEMITGLDLVEWQLRVAAGERLPLSQQQITFSGHAVEVRLYAETPENGFLPSIGTLKSLDWGWSHHPPAGVRIDTGVESGDEVTPHYDPMLAKVIAHGADRATAIGRLQRQLMGTRLLGPGNNLGFLQRLLADELFQHGNANTQYIDANLDQLTTPAVGDRSTLLAAVARLLIDEAAEARLQAQVRGEPYSPWASTDSWGFADGNRRGLTFADSAGKPVELSVRHINHFGQRLSFACEQRPSTQPQTSLVDVRVTGALCKVNVDGEPWVGAVHRAGDQFEISTPEQRVVWRFCPPLQIDSDDTEDEGALTAPMPGTVLQINVAVGDKVEPGQLLMIVEAMKMEHSIVATRAGAIAEVCAAVGDFVQADTPLVVFS